MSAEATSAAELKYLQSTAALDFLCKEEEIRRVRLRSLLLSDELGDSNDRLFEEAERADLAESDAQYWQDLSNEYLDRIERDDSDSRTRTRELEALKAELASLQSISADSKSLLTAKLALSHDLETLKPELEHLRSQVASHQKLFAEKLALQHELSLCQAELEESKRNLQRLQARQGKSSEKDMQLESEINQLTAQLAKEKREREKAEKLAESTGVERADELRRELAKEKREREKADKAAGKAAVESDELDQLKKDLAVEKRERAKAEKLVAKSVADWEAQKAVLDDKLEQFRTKLRSTKETLRETQEALEQAQQPILKQQQVPQSRASRKRSAAQMDPDAAIGTPGDAAPNKRAKRATSVVLGEKSTFSITPFLNRTTSVAPESPKDIPEQDSNEPLQSIETVASPTAHLAKDSETSRKPIPLAPASPGRSNLSTASSKAVQRKKAAAPLTLEIVTEEADTNADTDNGHAADENNENIPPETATDPEPAIKQSKPGKPSRLSLKPKSLSSFATFREGSLPPQTQQKKKKKLLGGGGRPKTLFDEDEDEDGDAGDLAPTKAATSLAGQRAFGAFAGGRAFGGLGLLGGVKKKGPLVVANDGFMFSPLKKDRKAMAAAAAIAA